MEFHRVGEHTVRCVISEEEIANLGFSLDDIMSNNERTQEFMNHIFDMAEQEFAMHFDFGIKTVRADFLPDHNISLTFSEHQGSAMMEHLRDIVNGMLNSIPTDKWESNVIKGASVQEQPITKEDKSEKSEKAEEKDGEEVANVIVMITFDSLERVTRFAKQVHMAEPPASRLYKIKRAYVLALDLYSYKEDEVKYLSMITDEYCEQIEVGSNRLAYLEEHATILIEEEAIETLQSI